LDDNVKALLSPGLEDPETRQEYAASLLYAHIALQIKTLRQQRGWSQAKLAQLAGKHQSQISEMESIDFSSWKISTLMKLAEAFDLALTVSFESFGTFLDEAASLGRDALERPSFADDPAFHGEERRQTVIEGARSPAPTIGVQEAPKPNRLSIV
jgi:transcriptional regulator with XRE-family HTH domain